MEFIKAGTVAEFQDKRHKVLKIVGRLVGIIKRDDGSFFGIEASCKHQGADLLADYRGGTVAVCPRHQWQYDLESGQCLNHESLPLRKYEVSIDGENVMVSLHPVEDDVDFDYDYDLLK